ncbi:MAG: PEP-CTERM sorting domain-containing protein [Myxococcota bacterium]
MPEPSTLALLAGVTATLWVLLRGAYSAGTRSFPSKGGE